MIQLYGGPFDGTIIQERFPDILVPIENREPFAARYTFFEEQTQQGGKYIYIGTINQNDLVVEIENNSCKNSNCRDGKIINPDWTPNSKLRKYINCPECQKK